MPLGGYPGFSFSTWVPDEELLASSLNLRERYYGNVPIVDQLGIGDNTPSITIALIGPSIYGTAIYGVDAYGP